MPLSVAKGTLVPCYELTQRLRRPREASVKRGNVGAVRARPPLPLRRSRSLGPCAFGASSHCQRSHIPPGRSRCQTSFQATQGTSHRGPCLLRPTGGALAVVAAQSKSKSDDATRCANAAARPKSDAAAKPDAARPDAAAQSSTTRPDAVL